VAGSCEYGDEPSGSGAAELVSFFTRGKKLDYEITLLSLSFSTNNFLTN
jgi:hypothetical protein